MKKVIEWWRMRKRIGMSELGLELLEAMENDTWRKTEHVLEHKSSGIELWIANGRSHFKLYRVPGMVLTDAQKEHALNKKDIGTLWGAYHELLRRTRSAPADTVLNILRLGRIKESGEIK